MERQPSLCSQLSMTQVRNSMASTSDTDDVLNQILRGGSGGSSIRKSYPVNTTCLWALSTNANLAAALIKTYYTCAFNCLVICPIPDLISSFLLSSLFLTFLFKYETQFHFHFHLSNLMISTSSIVHYYPLNAWCSSPSIWTHVIVSVFLWYYFLLSFL